MGSLKGSGSDSNPCPRGRSSLYMAGDTACTTVPPSVTYLKMRLFLCSALVSLVAISQLTLFMPLCLMNIQQLLGLVLRLD